MSLENDKSKGIPFFGICAILGLIMMTIMTGFNLLTTVGIIIGTLVLIMALYYPDMLKFD